MKGKHLSQVNPPSRDIEGKDKSGDGKKATECETLANWRPQWERQVRTGTGRGRFIGTHFLQPAERGTIQDTERMRPSQGHSLPVDHRGMHKSGH